MRLIDADAFREDYALGERCEDCRRFGKKDCDYPAYSARDFCGWLDDAPTVELTDEAAIEHLQASGWMQNHDREMSKPHWISVKDRLPEEHPSIFDKLYGTEKWNHAMWRTESDRVLVAIRFADGSRTVDKGKLQEGKWRTGVSPVLPQEVTHWALWPEPPEEDETNDKA